jgi:hypothetical protein
MGALAVGACALVAGCARHAPPTCDRQTVRVAVGDTRWAFPAESHPFLPTGTYRRGAHQELCPLEGRQTFTVDSVSVYGDPKDSTYAPPVGVLVTVQASASPQSDIAERPAVKGAETPVADPDSARLGLVRRDMKPFRIYSATGADAPFSKVICSQPSPRTAAVPGPSARCSAYFANSPHTFVEVRFYEPGWTVARARDLRARIESYLSNIRETS